MNQCRHRDRERSDPDYPPPRLSDQNRGRSSLLKHVATVRRPLTDESGEVRELTKADLVDLKPMAGIDPGMIEAGKNKGGRPKSDAPKAPIEFRMAADFVQAIKATGKGYNARVEKVLRDAYEQGKLGRG
jgi:uncharacterized protein (DUF4415 family)